MKRCGFVLFSHLRLATIEKLFKLRRYRMQEECLAFSRPSVVRSAGKRTSLFAAEIVIECELLDKIGSPPKIYALQAGMSRPTIANCGVRFQSYHANGTVGVVPRKRHDWNRATLRPRFESYSTTVGRWQGSVGREQHDLGPPVSLGTTS